MILHKTKDKCCIEAAAIEVQPMGDKLFKDISVCGPWCTKYIEKYECCIDVLHKLHAIKVMQDDLG